MKKLFTFIILLSSVGFAADPVTFPQKWETIQVSSTATPSNLGTPLQVQVGPSNVSNVKITNCITKLSWSGDNYPAAGATISVLDRNATYYSLTLATGPLVEIWPPEYPLCLSANTTTYVQVSTGNFKVNVSAYRRDF